MSVLFGQRHHLIPRCHVEGYDVGIFPIGGLTLDPLLTDPFIPLSLYRAPTDTNWILCPTLPVYRIGGLTALPGGLQISLHWYSKLQLVISKIWSCPNDIMKSSFFACKIYKTLGVHTQWGHHLGFYVSNWSMIPLPHDKGLLTIQSHF